VIVDLLQIYSTSVASINATYCELYGKIIYLNFKVISLRVQFHRILMRQRKLESVKLSIWKKTKYLMSDV